MNAQLLLHAKPFVSPGYKPRTEPIPDEPVLTLRVNLGHSSLSENQLDINVRTPFASTLIYHSHFDVFNFYVIDLPLALVTSNNCLERETLGVVVFEVGFLR